MHDWLNHVYDWFMRDMLSCLQHWFSAKNIMFTVLDYDMSYIEFFGTITCIWAVWLIAKRNVWTWPIGTISVLLYMFLFYQIQLYSDTIEQIYYLVTNIYGWWVWETTKKDDGEPKDIVYSKKEEIIFWVVLTSIVAILTGYLMTNIHIWLPSIFPEKASLPYLDALTTIMSFTAMWLMVKKKVESWIYWVLVDTIAVPLYYYKGIKFVALLYFILWILAVNGFRLWHNVSKQQALKQANQADVTKQ